MLTIPELLRDHVTLDVECVDRVYLNGYIPTLQTSGSLVYFLEQHRGNLIASPVLLNEITKTFAAAAEAYAAAHQVPLIHFPANQRKDDLAAVYRRQFSAKEGVVFIGVA